MDERSPADEARAAALIGTRVEGGVAVVTMNRPERKNAFDHAMWGAFEVTLRAVLADPAVRVVVLTGAGGDFTAGADFTSMELPDEPREPGDHAFSKIMSMLISTFDKPLIAAVDGVAVGFGLTVLLHCEFVYVSTRVRLRAPFVRLGVVPEAGASYLLPALVGFRKAAEILYTADWIDGPRAVDLGIAHACVAPEDLLATALATATRIAEHPPQAVRGTKRLLLETRREQMRAALDRESAVFAERLGTPENVEAIRAFYEKRKPDFSKLSDS
jgi:enoyl-CoA hydratase/carnithine racemase